MPQSVKLSLFLKINEPKLLEALKELLPQAGIHINEVLKGHEATLYTPPAPEKEGPSLNFFELSTPVSFLDLLSHLENLPYQKKISFAHFSLDLREKNLTNRVTQQTQRLTEKEVQILRYFHHHKGQDISKETLLKEIWEYHPKTETHTLETHIYRLRQKLEKDPNDPEILLNSSEGYLMCA